MSIPDYTTIIGVCLAFMLSAAAVLLSSIGILRPAEHSKGRLLACSCALLVLAVSAWALGIGFGLAMSD